MQKPDKYEIISELARRRGFFWPSYEIYGGASGFLTYGPLGSTLKRKVEETFRDFYIKPFQILEMESSIVTPARVFDASGHVNAFREPMVECSKCKRKFRADHLLQEKAKMSDTETEKLDLKEIAEEITKHSIKCLECGEELGKPKYFMTMFSTTIGPYSESIGYGRPEAAQGVFVEFKRLYEVARERLPMGVAQIGHALRNEISPRQGPLRLREFTIADIELFFDPAVPQCPILKEIGKETLRLIPAKLKQRGADKLVEVTVKEALEKGYIRTEWQACFMTLAKHFLNKLGVPDDKQRFIEKLDWERAHYSAQGYDQEIYLKRWGWTEVSGHNYRTDYDLKQHMKHSGVDMQVFKEHDKPILKEKVIIEPVLARIGPTFKKDSSKVADLLRKADAREVEKSLKEDGYFMLRSFRIMPDHVKIIHRKVDETGRRFIPHTVEPSFGIDRLVYVVLEYAYSKREGRTLLKLPRELSPVQVGVYPLVTKDGLAERARKLHRNLLIEGFVAEYDEAGSIGRRYARADEAGIPLCITIDYHTLDDDTVTIRDRDSWKQVRIETKYLSKNLNAYFSYKNEFRDMGKSL
ncbi:MAG: glycine--tRNA ligase [Candidatus Bathyarchaeota archaeon]|nr:MAG: glycine--tRNA ligase [Candidatus Bathyarchaeota archaeon]